MNIIFPSLLMSNSLKILILFLLTLFFANPGLTQEISENEVEALLDKSQNYFKEKKFEQLLNLLTDDFTYEVFTSVDGETYDDKMNLATYAEHLRIFFENNPDVEEYSDKIESIKIYEDKATLELKTNSYTTVGGVTQRCSGTAVYKIVKRKDRLLVKTIRGKNQCTNSN